MRKYEIMIAEETVQKIGKIEKLNKSSSNLQEENSETETILNNTNNISKLTDNDFENTHNSLEVKNMSDSDIDNSGRVMQSKAEIESYEIRKLTNMNFVSKKT